MLLSNLVRIHWKWPKTSFSCMIIWTNASFHLSWWYTETQTDITWYLQVLDFFLIQSFSKETKQKTLMIWSNVRLKHGKEKHRVTFNWTHKSSPLSLSFYSHKSLNINSAGPVDVSWPWELFLSIPVLKCCGYYLMIDIRDGSQLASLPAGKLRF